MSIRLGAERAFILAPHPDDGELGCGGTISRLVDEGVKVHYIAFSACQHSLPAGWPPDTREKEVRSATRCLGIDPACVVVYDFEVRRFDTRRQEILDALVQLGAEFRPDLIFLPCPQDMHQDHVVVANEGIRAFKHSTVLAYELPWNNLTFSTQGFIALEKHHLERKLDALECYASQRHRPYADPSFIRGLARTRGVESGHEHAEAFQIIRLNVGTAATPRASDTTRNAENHAPAPAVPAMM